MGGHAREHVHLELRARRGAAHQRRNTRRTQRLNTQAKHARDACTAQSDAVGQGRTPCTQSLHNHREDQLAPNYKKKQDTSPHRIPPTREMNAGAGGHAPVVSMLKSRPPWCFTTCAIAAATSLGSPPFADNTVCVAPSSFATLNLKAANSSSTRNSNNNTATSSGTGILRDRNDVRTRDQYKNVGLVTAPLRRP